MLSLFNYDNGSEKQKSLTFIYAQKKKKKDHIFLNAWLYLKKDSTNYSK